MVNPDCIAQKGSLDVLAARFRAIGASAGLVEGRQWPFEHPKEYDPESGRTPWASGAFVLVNDTFYERVGGMDEAYFLYTEDVDLSWQAWLNDFEVVYEPRAAVIHFSGGAFYRSDLVSREEFYSLRNFIGINSKFFGPHGEESARTLAQRFGDPALVRQAIRSYEQELKPRLKLRADGAVHHPMIKVLGLNQFHEIRAQ
ncbi:hypothetical protein [Rhodovulum sp. PH10]|uniref:hypothetical protein n=1 Tax=Rhodovulum sp. PH10 TaxID=1187851 RepID=UPI000689F93B|nr:hypothetical protein [Rhodovulum sp. PH10]